MKTWMTGLKLCRYALQFKLQTGMAVFFLIFGLIVEFGSGGTNLIGGFYLVVSGIFIVQMILSVGQSAMVQASPRRRKLETMVPAACGFIFCFMAYTIYVLVQTYFNYFRNESSGDASDVIGSVTSCGAGILLVTLILFLMEIYMGFVYKFFVLGVATICLGIGALMTSENCTSFAENLAGRLGFGGVVAIGYVLMLLGGLLEYALLCLLYKRPYSKYAFGYCLRRMR